MTQKERIAKLEAEVTELRLKIAFLESRPAIVMIPAPLPAQPSPWSPQPWTPSYPNIGDPTGPTIICKSQAEQNVASASANMSFVQ